MFSKDYKRGVYLDDLDVGLDWYAMIKYFVLTVTMHFFVLTFFTFFR